MKKLGLMVFITSLIFASGIAVALYFVIQGTISAWWLAMAVPAFIVAEAVIAFVGWTTFVTKAEEMESTFMSDRFFN